jgi:hypothetical protein
VAFFEGFQSLIKKKKPKKKASPTLTTQSQNINMERRLKAAGAKVPKPKKKGNWFTRLMKALDHPANIVRTGVTAYYRTGSKQKAITAAKAARDKGVYTPGTKLLETMAKRGAPLAKWATKTPIRKAVSGFATDVLLDPLTYTTVGTRRVAMGVPELTNLVRKEMAKETGKKLSRKSAERLAQNALKGQVPTGRMGTAIERAMGRKAETRGAATGYGKLTATEQKVKIGKQAAGKRQSMAELAKKAEELKQGKLPKSGALPPGKITDAEIRAQIARKEAKAEQLKQQAKKLKKGELPKAGVLPGRVKTDFIAGYKAYARSEPRTVQWAGKEMDARDLLKYQKNLEKQAQRIMRGATQTVRHGYKAAKESDIYALIRQKTVGIAPSKSGLFAGEYRETVPIALRNKNGLPIDELADELGMSVRELLDRLRNRVVPTSDDIRREAQQVAYSNPEFKRIMQEIGKIDDHISHLEQAGRKTTSGVEPFVAKVGEPKYPKVTNVEAKRTGREMAKSLDQQSKLLSAEARKLTQQITPGEVTNIEARKLGRQLAKPYEQEAKGFARAARELEKQADKIKPKQGFAAVTEAAGKPGRDVTAIRFMGQDMIDITPIAKPIRTAMGAVIEASPFLTKVTDRLGRTFVFNYTPKGIKGLERELVKGAKERVTQTMREVPYSRSKAMRETLEKWKGVGREAAEEAPGIIEKTSGFASVAGRQAAEKAAKLFDYDVQRFAKEGIPLDVVDNYVQHIYKDPPEKVRQILAAWRQKSQVTGARPSFTKQRSIPTLAQAEAMGLHPIKDVRQLTMVHRALTEQAVTINRMGKDLIRMGDMIVRKTDPGGWVNVTHTAIPALQGKYVHPEVAKALDNLLPVATNTDEGMRTLMGAIDGLTSAWKGVVLFRPSFHARNAIGNVFLNIADGMMNPGRYAQALAVYSGVLPHVNLAGKRVPSSAVLDWFEREALKGQGMFRESLHGRTKGVTEQAARMINALEKRGYNVRYYLRHPFEASREFGEATDSIGRLANFLHHLDSGKPIKEAAQRTRLALFDYGALTNAERKIRSSIMPFYTWVRFALPRMCEKLVGAPGLFTGSSHLRENMVRYNEIDEQNMPEWLEEMQAIPLWVDPQGNVHYMTWNLPLTELTKIKEPGDIKNIAEEVAMMMNPLMTVPVQLASNRQVMGGMPITQFEDLGGKHMLKDYGKWAISQLGMPAEIAKAQREAQMHREYQEAVDKGEAPEIEPSRKSPFERVLQFTSVQNPASWQRQSLYQRNRQLQQAIKAAQREGIEVPSTEEIGRPGEKKGFAKVAEGKYGRGFAGQAAKGVAKDVGSVPDAINQALQITGVDASWGPYMKLLMQAESGGNPMARNPIWVNYRTGQQARGGRPGPGWYQATGLYQMMEPTFRSYAAPGHDDIYNPLDNTIASINYIKSRYGHPANIPRLGQPGYRGY